MARRNSARRSATTRPKACHGGSTRCKDGHASWRRRTDALRVTITDRGVPLAREVTLQQERSTMTPVPVPAPPASEPAAARSSWLDTATLVLLTTSWVYLTGWAYAWRCFSHVQLGLLA